MSDNTKKWIKFIIAIIVFFSSSIFKLATMYLFKLDPAIPFNRVLINLISNILAVSLLFFLYKDTLITDFKRFKQNIYNCLEIGIKYWTTGLIVMMISNFIISYLLKINIASNEQSVRMLLKSSPVIGFILIAGTVPIIEELVFRKAFRDIFKNKWSFVLTSGIVFGSLHVLLSLHSPLELLYLIPYCSLGIAFSYIYYESNNIYTSIAIHSLHNAILSIKTIIPIGMIIW